MQERIQKHRHAFKNAFNGFFWAAKTQHNYQVHLVISLIVIILGFIFTISYIEWLFIIFAITLGLVIEALNTALEATTDAITKEWRPEIKIAKDVAAAAMLTYAIGVTILALFIFGPKLTI